MEKSETCECLQAKKIFWRRNVFPFILIVYDHNNK